MALAFEEAFEEEDELKEFFSDDGEHYVIWRKAEDTDYPIWYCVTHKKHYYRDCT